MPRGATNIQTGSDSRHSDAFLHGLGPIAHEQSYIYGADQADVEISSSFVPDLRVPLLKGWFKQHLLDGMRQDDFRLI
jgi:hypothetical protein